MPPPKRARILRDVTPPGKIILVNGPSSAGKSTLGRALQAELPEPFLVFSLDLLMFEGGVLPPLAPDGPFAWSALRPRLFEGFFNCLPALAAAGNNLVVDFIIETAPQWTALSERLRGLDVFLVGAHCAVEELERREAARGDRHVGDARRDLETVHTFTAYDAEVDTALPAEHNARLLARAWAARAARTGADR